jgi:hypothetical protein
VDGRWYIDLSVSIFGITGGFALNEDGSVHPYMGVSTAVHPQAALTVGTGEVEPGGCVQVQGSWGGAAGAGGYCPGSGSFSEMGIGTPGASASYIHYA